MEAVCFVNPRNAAASGSDAAYVDHRNTDQVSEQFPFSRSQWLAAHDNSDVGGGPSDVVGNDIRLAT